MYKTASSVVPGRQEQQREKQKYEVGFERCWWERLVTFWDGITYDSASFNNLGGKEPNRENCRQHRLIGAG